MQHSSSSSDEYFIDETLRLAKKAMGWTNPNPMVGAVIVTRGQIIARGYHKRAELPVWWSIFKIVRTHFAAAGGENLAKNSEPKF